jgi:hypothetical protein
MIFHSQAARLAAGMKRWREHRLYDPPPIRGLSAKAESRWPSRPDLRSGPMREEENLLRKRGDVLNPSSYLRYLVIQIRAARGGAGVWWHSRALSAAEGYRILESRIAEEYLGNGVRPLIALIDCSDRRILASSAPVGDASYLLAQIERFSVLDRSEDAAESLEPGRGGTSDTPAASEGADGTHDDPAERLIRGQSVEANVGESPDVAMVLDEATIQNMIDRLHDEMTAGVGATIPDDLMAWLESSTAPEPDHRERRLVSLDRLCKELAAATVQRIVDAVDIAPADGEVTEDMLTDYVGWCLLPRLLETESCYMGPVDLRTSRWELVTFARQLRQDADGGRDIVWYGPIESWDAYEEVIATGWIGSANEFAMWARERKLALFRLAGWEVG